MNNRNTRFAKCLIRYNLLALAVVPHIHLLDVARGWAKEFRIPKPIMLRAMKRWARLNH